jgi:hypothetical protein
MVASKNTNNELTPKGMVHNFILLPSSDKIKEREIKEAYWNLLNNINSDLESTHEERILILQSK